jgi:L-alanine-DL-glutamate epimerase-like enolase superfamily enzyme
MNRRQMLASAGLVGVGATADLLMPVRAIALEAKGVKIQNVEIFDVLIPTPQEKVDAGARNRYNVVKVDTNANVRGYSFVGAPIGSLGKIREILVGQDLFVIEQHLKRGLIAFGGVEEALWDAIGKIAGQPVCRLLGGAKAASVPVYLTYVWPGNPDQSQVPFKDQAAQALKVKNAGFKGMKIRIFRPDFMDDVKACAEIRGAVGKDFYVMVDRTAGSSGKLWNYPTALAAAKALQEAGVYWLEEPFDRNDFDGPARLAREVEILITGGEGFNGLSAYRECLTHDTYDILQPDCRAVGGILTMRKVAALAEAWEKPVCPHASSGLSLAGRLQGSAAQGSRFQEIGVLRPPALPQDVSEPALQILNTKEVYRFKDGEIEVPQHPGLGLDLNEEAIQKFRVEASTQGFGGGRRPR